MTFDFSRRIIAAGIAATFGGFAAAAAHAQDTEAAGAIPDNYELVYHEDFEGEAPLDDFTFTDAEAWEVGEDSGNHFLALTGESDYEPPHRSPYNIALLADRKLGDFILEARVMQTGEEYGHRDLCFFFGFQDPAHYYYAHIAKAQDPHAHNVFVVDEEPRVKFTDESTDGFDWGDMQWQRLRLVRDAGSGEVRLFMNDMTEPIFVANDSRFQRGWLGFGSFDDTGRFDDIHIWTPDGAVEREQVPAFNNE